MIDELPAAPDPGIDPPIQFRTKAVAMVIAQKNMVPQINQAVSEVNANTQTAAAAAANAVNAAATVTAVANTTKWAAGNYNEGQTVWSTINQLTYRRKATGASAVDPANDDANWTLLSSGDLFGNDNALAQAYALASAAPSAF